MSGKVEPEKLPPNYEETKVDEPIQSQPVSLQGWHALRYFLFSLPIFFFQPSWVEGLQSASKESAEPSGSNKVVFNPVGLTGAEISALKVEK